MLIGIDTGGTFTDFVGRTADGRAMVLKVQSTPDDPSRAMLEGINQLLSELKVSPAEVERVVHGTTVATNTMLEYTGAMTGLITTAGFRDTIEIRRNYKEAAIDIRLPAPYQIVPRRRRLGVTERIDLLTFCGACPCSQLQL